ncbi:recombinase family protein [Methylobacterium oxalidis]|uniref:recombinase family protein n=1 Tax=Methylobacterium oxalidis TaxID=944322 RepID=UPI00331602B9
MKGSPAPKFLRCAIYTRKSTEQGLDQAFNSLDNQREAAEAYIKSQAHEGWRLLPETYDDGGYSGGSLQRPALQRLLAEVQAGRVDVIVVYKVDRLTRALSDFAKLVELFDQHGVSFVSVTQAFNTTTSMGRLTLNVLLSFAQFEREVTAERIRDKIAASKQKGIWMGGVVPLGYRAEKRTLQIVPEHAALVRLIFERYLACGSVIALASALERDGLHAPDRRSATGGRVRGGVFSRGHLYKLLSARVYLGEITHRGRSYPGQHTAIVERALFEAVAARLAEQRRARRQRMASEALLGGRLYDAHGNAMSPTYTQKGGVRYRYYVSQALLQGRAKDPGRANEPNGRLRVAAPELEQAVVAALRRMRGGQPVAEAFCAPSTMSLDPAEPRPQSDGSEEALMALVERIVLANGEIRISLSQADSGNGADMAATDPYLIAPWSPTPRTRHRATMVPEARDRKAEQRLPMPEDVRRKLLVSIAQARAWTTALSNGTAADASEIAQRHGCSERSVRMLLPLVSLAPDLVQAAVEGRLPAGYGAARLCRDLPLSWPEQLRLIPILAERPG